MRINSKLPKRVFAGVVLSVSIAACILFSGCSFAGKDRNPSQSKTDPAAQKTASVDAAGWKSLFNGKNLAGWQTTDFVAHGPVTVQSNRIIIENGTGDLNGINWTNQVPFRMDYEIALEAMKLDGSDFFCGLTFPVGTNYCSLILGGWGGSIVGLSSLDGSDASENETSTNIDFALNQWYRVRVRVTETRIEAWLDDAKIVNAKTVGREVAVRVGEIEDSIPLGVATYQTRAAIRDIKMRPVLVESPK